MQMFVSVFMYVMQFAVYSYKKAFITNKTDQPVNIYVQEVKFHPTSTYRRSSH